MTCALQFDFTMCSGGLLVCLVVLMCFGFLCIFIRNYVRIFGHFFPVNHTRLVESQITVQWRRNEFESGGAPIWRTVAEKKFLVVPLHFFGSKVQLVVLVSAFVMVSTVWSVSCLLFFYSRCRDPPQVIVLSPSLHCVHRTVYHHLFELFPPSFHSDTS